MKLRTPTGIVIMALLYLLTSAGTLSARAAAPASSVQFAEDVSVASPSQTASAKTAVHLMIDSQNCYEGMEKPYAEGYLPKIENGFVRLIVPILATGELQNHRLQVSLDFGDGAAAPFVMKNYNKTIFLKTTSVNGGSQTVESYVADFQLELKEKRNNGSYPVQVEVKGIAEDGSAVSKEFRIYVTITDGTAQENGVPGDSSSGTDGSPGNGNFGDDGSGTEGNPGNGNFGDGDSGTGGTGDGNFGTDGGGNGDSGTDGSSGDGADALDDALGSDVRSGLGQSQEEPPSFAPKILVESCRLTPKEPLAGEEVTAEIILKNTSKQELVKNMTITLSAASEYLSLTGTEDTVYIEKLSPQKTCVLSCQYQMNAAAPQGRYELELSMEYADAKGNNYTAVRKVRLSSYQTPKMLFDPLAVPAELAVADVVEVSAQAINLGKTKVFNVRAVLQADGLRPEGTIFIGDMEPGTKASGSTQVSVSGLSKGDSLYGETEGVVTFYYEDETGQERTESMEFQTVIRSPFSPEVPQKEEKAGQWWLIMAATGGFFLLFGAFLTGRRMGQRKLS